MMRAPAFIARHPVAAYFVIAFSISWGGVLLAIGGVSHIPSAPEETARLFPYALMAMLAGPCAAGLLLIGLIGGRAGYREFLSRLLRWRVEYGWYAVALLTVPVLATIILSVLSLASPVFVPDIVTSSSRGSLLLQGIAMGMIAGLFEEPGWTGFAGPRLRQRYGTLATGLIVGLLWGLWHFLVTIWGSGDSSGALSWDLLIPPLLFYVGVLPVYRVLMVVVFDRTESLLIAMLMHASLTACTLFLLKPPATGTALVIYYIILAAALWGVVAAIAATNRGRFPRRRLTLR